ncbi:hypothetical protein [Cupriavidus metallidurans]|uniref:hypothetical protein n=1 Tax=Cupriavidus metallidurans TaxID=119219 RepID=UPI001CCFB374|nr:hypothetical protein [Cupriavidus metallidurans]UBM12689.1 hypothetical protein LAI70_28155 [Cupriavidus metallidurans]
MIARLAGNLLNRMDPINMPIRVHITKAEMAEMMAATRGSGRSIPRDVWDAYWLCYDAHRKAVPVSDFNRDIVLKWARSE